MTPYSAQTRGHNATLPPRPPHSRYRHQNRPLTIQAGLFTPLIYWYLRALFQAARFVRLLQLISSDPFQLTHCAPLLKSGLLPSALIFLFLTNL